jgi:hypothetical protein
LYQSIIAVENNIFKYQGFDSPIIDYLWNGFWLKGNTVNLKLCLIYLK